MVRTTEVRVELNSSVRVREVGVEDHDGTFDLRFPELV